MRLIFLTAVILLFTFSAHAQATLNYSVDTSEADVNAALYFYQSYLHEFQDTSLPDFSKYWSPEDCRAYKYPDQMIFAIASDYPTYKMGKSSVLYVKPQKEFIQIKTLFARQDSTGMHTFAITNHYIKTASDGKLYFINPVEAN